MNPNSEVIVVGSGPAGALAAHTLAAAGIPTQVLERAVLPRDKPCGGALSPQVRKIIPWDYSQQVAARSQSMLNLFNHQRPVTNPVSGTEFVCRPDFDLAILERALACGSHLVVRERCAVEAVEEHAHGIRVRCSDGNLLSARYLIAADGAASRCARSLGLNRHALMAAAIDAELIVSDTAWERESRRATFNFFCVPGGYGWIFPKRANTLTCGVGCWRQRNGLPMLMQRFLTESFADGEIRAQRLVGHPIPLYMRHARIATRRVCLVGDAASMVDPILGEGIRFALISGAQAARSVIEQIQADRDGSCEDYQRQIQGHPGSHFINLARFVLPMFLKAPELFYSRFIENKLSYHRVAESAAQRFGFAAADGRSSAVPSPG